MTGIGMQHFQMSLELEGLRMQCSQAFVDYGKEVEEQAIKCIDALIEDFDLEKAIQIEVNKQFSAMVAESVRKRLRDEKFSIETKANDIIRGIKILDAEEHE